MGGQKKQKGIRSGAVRLLLILYSVHTVQQGKQRILQRTKALYSNWPFFAVFNWSGILFLFYLNGRITQGKNKKLRHWRLCK
jgi:hypothetical protein